MIQRSRGKRIWEGFGIALLTLGLLVIINLIPTFRLRTAGMQALTGAHVTLWYETEREAAGKTFTLAEARAAELAMLLGVTQYAPVEVFVYDSQQVMQQKKYGLIAPLLGLDWYIGDNVGTRVLLTSPANPGRAHSAEDVQNAVLHELVHAYNAMLNPRMTYWLDNALAGWLSGQTPARSSLGGPLPSLADTRVSGLLAPLTFERFGGYGYSYTYAAYLEKTFGWARVRALAAGGAFENALGQSEQAVYDGWAAYVR